MATPLASGVSATITSTTAAGATNATQAAAGVAVVGDMRLSGIAAYYIWSQGVNGQAQERARQRYCAAYPKDVVCRPFEGGQSTIIYVLQVTNTSIQFINNGYLTTSNGIEPFPGPIKSITQRGWDRSNKQTPLWDVCDYKGFCRRYRASSTGAPVDPHPLVKALHASVVYPNYNPNQVVQGGSPPPLPWKDWSQEKRSIAVAALTPADWLGLITSMPEAGRLIPGDTVKTPGNIVIPGQEEDDPNTPADERLLRKDQGFFKNPGRKNFDYDADGTADADDPEPQNPNVPRASGDTSGGSSDPADPNASERLDTSQEPRPEPLSEIPETTKARDLAEAKAAELRETIRRKDLPRATAAVVDTKTGDVYYGTSGKPLPTTIDEYLNGRW